ncbi:uncharacterized protein LOC123530617 isoform X2 [Mercenaria mercenaria]|uniref:uncharacterized protein LOC123530617 isoform X2 n=1 Tax=Mercenaria mercenaria TaxID=6596 RepID=UPI00234F870F|nr:uncharacterized protein LOC123530617 isoform X2 [Mercenaria mercenaria]
MEEFDARIKDMSVKNLIDTITVLQKEMSKEQENFNALSGELGTLKRNSGQYKSISKDMTASQTRLTLLMNRSMKCFSQQGNQQSKTAVERRNSFQGTQSKGNVQNRASEPVKTTVVTQSAVAGRNSVNTADQSKRQSDIGTSNRTSISVQSLKSNSPVLRSKANDVNGSGNINGEKRQSLPLSVNDNNKTENRSRLANEVNDNTNVNGQQKPVSVSNTGVSLGPMAEQRNKYLSKSSDNVFKKPSETAPHKPEVVKGKTSAKPVSKVVMNADKQMIDLDSFTERKNMLDELKKFDKTLKPSVARTHTEKVTEVKLNLAKSGEKRTSANMEPKGSVTPVEQTMNLLGDIKLGKKPSELKQTMNVKTEQNGSNREIKDTRESVKVETESTRASHNDSQTKKFDDLLKDVDSDKSEQSSDDSPRETVVVSKQKETSIIPKVEKNTTPSDVGRRNGDIPASGEVTIEEAKASIPAVETSDDSLSQSSGMSEEEDKFVTEFHFTGSQIKTPVEAAIPKKQENVKQKQDVTPKIQQSTKTPAAPQPGSNVNKAEVITKGQSSTATAASGIHGNKDNDEEEELVVDTRVKFREWDPCKLLAKLYEVRMMPDNIEDISHKFIGMEGLMEKLPMNKKKATLLKTWKRRFFRAQDGWLHYYETGNKDKPSDSLQLMGGKVEELGPRVLGVDDGRGKYLMVRVPTDHEFGLWKVALESQTADNVKATYVRPSPASIPHPKKKVVIIDIGSSGIRAGILGERATLPQVFFPSIVAVHKQTGEIIVGADALRPDVRKSSKVSQPIQPTNKVDKFNIDMAVMKAILLKVFTDLNVNQSQYLVMLSTPQNLGDKLREGLMRILVDEMRVQGVCMVQQSLLALYSYNAMSGIIVDIGERLEILPIYDGLLIEGGVSRQAYGGAKIQDSLNISLLENKYQFSSFVEKLLVRYICEQACYVTDNYTETKEKCDADPKSYSRIVECAEFDLPEGAFETVDLDYACFKSPEGFFNTDLWEMDYKNIQKQIYAAIQQCPMDSRKQMYRSIYLSGGVTTIPGFAERLQEEMRKLAPPAAVVEVHASPQRYHSAYIGACSVASMDVFEMSCVSADEWKKMGVKACRKWGTG